MRQTCRCPERSRDPNGLPGPVESRRDLMRLRPPGLYGVWCRTPDVEEYRGPARVACSAVEIASDPTAFLCCRERGGEVQRWTTALVATINPRPALGDYHARAPSETARSRKGCSAMLNLTSSRPSATANAARARTIDNLRVKPRNSGFFRARSTFRTTIVNTIAALRTAAIIRLDE
jgi:hypothetical protein